MEKNIFEFLYFDSYFFILFYVFFSLVISLILILLSIVLRYLSLIKPDIEMASAYECGFLPFDKTRSKFEVKFFLIALLFVLFDLEVMFILPWTISLVGLPLSGIILMITFLSFLVLAFLFEIIENALAF